MNTLDLLTKNLFDYAGMFPPAKLSFKSMLAESAKLAQVLHRPALCASKIVIPVSMLDKLTDQALQTAGFLKSERLPVAILSDSSLIKEDIKNITSFFSSSSIYTKKLNSIELTFDESIGANSSMLLDYFEELKAYSTEVLIFFELKQLQFNPALSETIIDLLTRINSKTEKPFAGIKLRFGGKEALSTSEIVSVLDNSALKDLPFKATAGLHHPIVEKERYNNLYGFLGVLLAVLLQARGENLSKQELENIITVNDAYAFNFTEHELKFKHYSLTKDEIIVLRKKQPVSIGTCSLHDPDADLKRLFD